MRGIQYLKRKRRVRRWAALANILRPGGHGVTIFCYHRIDVQFDHFVSTVHPKLFERQLRWLKNWCRFITLEEGVDILASGSKPARKCVVVTFDDGYRDNYTQAFPILKKLEIPATIFLATGVIGTNKRLWYDRLSFYLERSVSIEEKEFFRDIPKSIAPLWHRYIRGSPKERTTLTQEIAGVFKRSPPQDQNAVLGNLAAACDPERMEKTLPRLMLDWDEIEEMNSSCISFGAHTIHHAILSKISENELKRQLTEPREIIKSHLGDDDPFLAYPNGMAEDFNDRVIEAVKNAGYKGAVTLIKGRNEIGQDPYRLFRKGAPQSPYLFV